MSNKKSDPAVLKARALFKESAKTLEELGVAMGYDATDARKSAWQFLNKTVDPRLSMLRRFAAAMNIPLVEFFDEENKSAGTL